MDVKKRRELGLELDDIYMDLLHFLFTYIV